MSWSLFKFFDAQGEKMSHLCSSQPDHATHNIPISYGKYFLAFVNRLGTIVALFLGNKRIYSSYANCKRQLVFF